MAWTQADIDSIDNAIKSNTLARSSSADRSVTYRSLDELIKARNFGERLQLAAAGGTPIRRQLRIYTKKGFDS